MIVQQACRQLVQSFAKSRAGGQLSGSFAYLSAASADRRLQSSFNFRVRILFFFVLNSVRNEFILC